MISALQPLDLLNDLSKYADDATLLVPEGSDIDLETKFSHIIDWTSANKLLLKIVEQKNLSFIDPFQLDSPDHPLSRTCKESSAQNYSVLY